MNIINHYQEIRNKTVEFSRHLHIEDFSIQVVKFASPVKWHLAHTTWFFETFILKKHLKNYTEFHPQYNFLFNSYYNNVGDRILQSNRGNMSRPPMEDIFAYRDHVDKNMALLLNNASDSDMQQMVILGLNHEQQHQELLKTDVKYMFGHNPIFPVFNEGHNLVADHNNSSETIKIPGGLYQIGHQDDGFCYDNELGRHQVYLDEFEINNFLVTNEEYIAFIESKGYSDFNLWLDDGWTWVNDQNKNAPMYWHKIDGEWHYYTLAGLQKIDPQAILCHINYYEANAFAEWKGLRLPTEFEWEAASQQLDWGKRWEWTNSAYLAYPNFRKRDGAVGEYNGKFMSNKMVLRGASVATADNHSRATYRNFFHPAERWQYTGIRLAK